MRLLSWPGRRRAGGYYDSGVSLLHAGDSAATVGQLRRAVRAAPAWAEAHNALGLALSASAQPSEAVGVLDRAVALRPDYAEAHSNRAGALLGIGAYDQALEAVQRALDIQPGYTLALEQRALVGERLRGATESGLAIGRRELTGEAAADDPLWGPALRAFESRIGDWALNREGVIAMWLGGQATAQTVLDGQRQARDFLHSADRALLEEYHHAFARRMVIRFARLAREEGANLTRAQLDEWLLLLDQSCGVSTMPAGLVETHLLDRQFEFALEGRDDSANGTGAHNLEPALTFAIGSWILGPSDRPNIARGSLPANSADEFVQRGGGGLPYDLRDVALAHRSLAIGEETLRRSFATLRVEDEARQAANRAP